MVRGVPTGASAAPLKSRLLRDNKPPTVWPYAEGKVRGISLAPLYKGAPKAALRDPKFYSVLALGDAIRSGTTRERKPRSRAPGNGDPDPNLQMLEDAVRKLAPFLDEIIFVAVFPLGLLINDEAAAPIRGTTDVDVIAGIVTYADYVVATRILMTILISV